MTAAPQSCQPKARAARQDVALVERLRVWPAAYGEDAMSSTYVGGVMKNAADRIEELEDALRNMMGAFDTPIARRRMPPDDFMLECLNSGRAALESKPAEETGK